MHFSTDPRLQRIFNLCSEKEKWDGDISFEEFQQQDSFQFLAFDKRFHVAKIVDNTNDDILFLRKYGQEIVVSECVTDLV